MNELPYAELMLWFYTQRKSYRFAIKQAISIDKRFNEDGLRLFDLGTQFIQQKEYKKAEKDHKIIIRDLTPKKFGKRDKIWTISLIVIIIAEIK